MSFSSPPPSDQHTTVSVFETPQSTSTFADLSPTGSSTKATENCTWEDIVVSAETTNPCVRKPSKKYPAYFYWKNTCCYPQIRWFTEVRSNTWCSKQSQIV